MIYVTFDPYTNKKGKVGYTTRVFNSQAKAAKYATARSCEMKAHKGSWVN